MEPQATLDRYIYISSRIVSYKYDNSRNISSNLHFVWLSWPTLPVSFSFSGRCCWWFLLGFSRLCFLFDLLPLLPCFITLLCCFGASFSPPLSSGLETVLDLGLDRSNGWRNFRYLRQFWLKPRSKVHPFLRLFSCLIIKSPSGALNRFCCLLRKYALLLFYYRYIGSARHQRYWEKLCSLRRL